MPRSLAVLGNILYHFDRALFGLLVPFLAPLFFPETDPVYALIYMYAILPLGFLAKPLGVWVFGRLGDRIGRGKTLSITLLGMAVKTAILGFLPTYSQVGTLAPVLLVVARLGFNFFAAGETTAGAIFLFERTKPEKRNFISSLFDASGILGIFLASAAVWLLSSYEGFWRFLFWSGAFIGIVGWFLRKIPDDGVCQPQPESTWKILWEHRRAVFSIASVAGFSYANYYLITTFMNGFLPLVSPLSNAQAVSLNTMLLGLDFLLLPLFGLLSTKVSKEKLMLGSILGIMVSAGPLLFLLPTATLFIVGCIRTILMIFGVCLAAPYHAWVFENSPPAHRYLIGAMGTFIGGKILGAPFPAISLWLYHKTGVVAAPGFLLIAIGFLAMISIPFKKTFYTKPVLGRQS